MPRFACRARNRAGQKSWLKPWCDVAFNAGVQAHPYVPMPEAMTIRYSRSDPQIPSFTAGLCYVEYRGEPLYNFMYEPPEGSPQHNCHYVVRAVRISDARSLSEVPSVHREGFELWHAPSAVADFRDGQEVERVYYDECATLACAVTGGKRAFVFDHQVRKREEGRPPLTFGRHGDGSQPAAAGRIHNDYTEGSGAKRLGLILGPSEMLGVSRYCIVNIWRSIAGPVQDTPLALCDARSVSAADLIVSEIRYRNRSGEIYLLANSARHRWFYYSQMHRDEALVFKQYDSQISGVARFVPHAAFDLPNIPAGAPLRESIEVRCLVVLE
jgi:hypothetical protein